MRQLDVYDMEEFGRLDSIENTRWRSQDGDRISKHFLYVIYGKSVMSARMLEVSLLEVGTVLRLERDAWSMAE